LTTVAHNKDVAAIQVSMDDWWLTIMQKPKALQDLHCPLLENLPSQSDRLHEIHKRTSADQLRNEDNLVRLPIIPGSIEADDVGMIQLRKHRK